MIYRYKQSKFNEYKHIREHSRLSLLSRVWSEYKTDSGRSDSFAHNMSSIIHELSIITKTHHNLYMNINTNKYILTLYFSLLRSKKLKGKYLPLNYMLPLYNTINWGIWISMHGHVFVKYLSRRVAQLLASWYLTL